MRGNPNSNPNPRTNANLPVGGIVVQRDMPLSSRKERAAGGEGAACVGVWGGEVTEDGWVALVSCAGVGARLGLGLGKLFTKFDPTGIRVGVLGCSG